MERAGAEPHESEIDCGSILDHDGNWYAPICLWTSGTQEAQFQFDNRQMLPRLGLTRFRASRTKSLGIVRSCTADDAQQSSAGTHSVWLSLPPAVFLPVGGVVNPVTWIPSPESSPVPA
jgi:hypothetical protein